MKNHLDKICSRLRLKHTLCISITLIVTLGMFASCKKLVEVGAPTSSLVTTTVFSNDATAITAQLAVYANLENTLYLFKQYTGLSADELTNYSTSQLKQDLYLNSLNASNDGGVSIYNVIYNEIYQENAIIENVPSSSGMSSQVKQFTAGEAKFMRAWYYFQLVNTFGAVPLVTSTDYQVNSSLPRAAVDQVYNQIVNDLQNAQTLLSSNYLDASDNTGATDRVRPTTWAADALLARVYLYMGKYDLAEHQASLVIANTPMFSLVSDLTKVFKMNSTEAIFQLKPAKGTLFTQEGEFFVLVTPPTTSIGQVTVSPQLLNAFEANDNRKTNWISNYTQGGTTWYFPYKYKDAQASNSLTEYSMVLRLGELYLIRAEARAQQGKLTGTGSAAEDLNVIRNRAGLPVTTTSSQAGLLNAIAHERQVELFTEDDRWFDLKRTKTVDVVMSVATPQKGGSWNSYQQLYPFIVSDLQHDPNLVQNSGY